MKTNESELDRKFDNNEEDVLEYFNLSNAQRINLKQTKIDLNLPAWMIQFLDREASSLGIDRQAVIKIWLTERIEKGKVSSR